jgi:hypothetical protein
LVGLEGVVGVKFRPMHGWRDHLVDEARVEAVPVGGDLDWRDPRLVERLGEEPSSSLGVASRWEEHADDLAELVDGPEQVAPGASDLDVGLIDVPAIPNDVAAGPGRVDELRGEALDPPVHRDVIDQDPALTKKLFHISVRETEPQVPTDRQRDDLGREAEPGEGRAWDGAGGGAPAWSHRPSLLHPGPADQRNSALALAADGWDVRSGPATFEGLPISLLESTVAPVAS